MKGSTLREKFALFVGCPFNGTLFCGGFSEGAPDGISGVGVAESIAIISGVIL
jgi:hypothetical protein